MEMTDQRQLVVASRPSTIRRWLAALVAAAVVPTFFGTAAALHYAYQERQDAFEQGLKDTTRALSLVVDREIARRQAIAVTLAESPTLTRGDLKAFHDYATRIAPTREKAVVLHALDGSQLVNTRLPFDAALPTASSLAPLRAASGRMATIVSNLYYAPVGQAFSFAVQVPVVREGQLRYYLSVAGFASALQSVIDDQRLPEGWIASILDAKGVVVARNKDPESFVGKRVSDKMLTQLSHSSEGAIESRSIDGTPILATYSKAPNYEWSVVVGVPLVIMPSLLGGIGTVAGLGALLLASALLATYLIAKRLIAPLERLQAATDAMGDGRQVSQSSTGIAETDAVLAGLHSAQERLRQATDAIESRRIEAQEAADALRMANTQVQLATDTAGLGLFTWFPQIDQVEWHNDLLFRIFGVDPKTGPVDAARFGADFLHPDDRESFASCVKTTMENGSPFLFVGRISRQSDSEIRWIEVIGRREGEDASAPIIGTVADITERVHAENALRASEERLRHLANTIPNLAWIADSDGTVNWYNDRWFAYTGTTPDEMRERGWQRLHHPDTLDEVVARWRTSIETGEIFEMPFVPLRGRDGEFRPFYTRVVPLRDSSGQIIQWFGTNTDVSTLKKAEDELREAGRRKDEFLAVLAHELRNPLAPIRSAAELLKRLELDEPRASKASEIISRQAVHMSALLDDLLDVSRITRGLLSVELSNVEVGRTVTNAIEQVRPNLSSRNQAVRYRQDDDSITVIANELRLTQIVVNLLDNASKFSSNDSTIDVTVGRNDNRVEIAVVDCGEGISSDLLPALFTPFTQGRRNTRDAKGGLGLGLAVVKGLVELQGGSVRALSAGPGQGSRFTVSLVAGEPISGTWSDNGPKGAANVASALRLLLVDDNADAVAMLSGLLREYGHTVLEATRPSDALRLARHAEFDAAIVDIGMPEMSGHDLARAMRADGLRIRTLIALSGYGQLQDREASLAAGFAYHLVKPVDPKSLLQVIDSIIGNGGPKLR